MYDWHMVLRVSCWSSPWPGKSQIRNQKLRCEVQSVAPQRVMTQTRKGYSNPLQFCEGSMLPLVPWKWVYYLEGVFLTDRVWPNSVILIWGNIFKDEDAADVVIVVLFVCLSIFYFLLSIQGTILNEEILARLNAMYLYVGTVDAHCIIKAKKKHNR